MGKSSSRFTFHSVVQGPAKAQPQLHSLRSVLGRHCCSGGLTWRGVAARSAPAPLCARSRWRLCSRVCPPGHPQPRPSHAALPASPLWTFGKQPPTPGARALTLPGSRLVPPGAHSRPWGPGLRSCGDLRELESLPEGCCRLGDGGHALPSEPERASGELAPEQRSGGPGPAH